MKEESHSEHNAIHISGDGASMKAERLAPLEEQTPQLSLQSPPAEGGIDVDTGSLKLPSPLGEEGKSGLFGLEPITLTIIIFVLAFIAFITYLISIEPPKTKDEPAPVRLEQKP